MAVYLIGYDLNREGPNYSANNKRLRQRIIDSFSTRWHELDSTWLVESTRSAETIRNDLRNYIDSNDELLVAALNGDAAWTSGFSQKAKDWLRSVLPRA